MKKAGLEIYSDGGARGNPGPGACAFVAKKGNEVLAKGAKFLGSVTNNFAEYSGVILALEWLTEQSPFRGEGLSIDFYLDSELVAKQLGGEYRVKNQTLKKLTLAIKEIIIKDDLQISFKHVPRYKNKTADFLVNQELDRNSVL